MSRKEIGVLDIPLNEMAEIAAMKKEIGRASCRERV